MIKEGKQEGGILAERERRRKKGRTKEGKREFIWKKQIKKIR